MEPPAHPPLVHAPRPLSWEHSRCTHLSLSTSGTQVILRVLSLMEHEWGFSAATKRAT